MALVGFVGLSLLVMAVNGTVTATGVGAWYGSLQRPPGTPPNSLFGPVWGVLYVLIGVSGWLAWRRVDVGVLRKRAALRLWGWQLLVNALWPSAFFGLHALGLGLAVILVLAVLIVLTMCAFTRIDPVASWLLAPYLAWVGYATYLNAGYLVLNPG